jgi:uncharacterized coiled-coil DUF342 family protein
MFLKQPSSGALKISVHDMFLKHPSSQRVDELLAEVDAARGMAKDAVDRAERTLQEAQSTLDILLKFNQEVQENKDKADDALLKIPEIERIIEEAEKNHLSP